MTTEISKKSHTGTLSTLPPTLLPPPFQHNVPNYSVYLSTRPCATPRLLWDGGEAEAAAAGDSAGAEAVLEADQAGIGQDPFHTKNI